MRKIILFSCCLISIHCVSQKNAAISLDSKFKSHPNTLSFYLFGDWGRDGQEGQLAVNKLMNASASVIPPQFIISTGDNFYPDGVKTVSDKQWQTSFENIYTGQALQCPWYVVLGNHDYHSNPQAEIDYSKMSKRWNMPARYFTKSVPLKDDPSLFADFVFIDTSPLEDDYYKEKHKEHFTSQDTTRQLRWLDSVLENSKARWKFVVGHHSMYTGGKRANDIPFVRKHLEKIFLRHRVDAYLCGHEHDLQHIKPAGHTEYFVSGAGSEIRKSGELSQSKFDASVNGFMVMSLTGDKLYVDVLDTSGKLIYQTILENDRK